MTSLNCPILAGLPKKNTRWCRPEKCFQQVKQINIGGVHIFNFSKYYVTCPLCALIDFIFAHHEWHLPPQLFLICSLASLVDGELYRTLIRQLNHLFYLEGLFTSLFPMVHLPSRLSDNSLSDPALMLPAVSLPNDQVSSLLTFYSVSQANCYKYLQTSTVSLK